MCVGSLSPAPAGHPPVRVTRPQDRVVTLCLGDGMAGRRRCIVWHAYDSFTNDVQPVKLVGPEAPFGGSKEHANLIVIHIIMVLFYYSPMLQYYLNILSKLLLYLQLHLAHYSLLNINKHTK